MGVRSSFSPRDLSVVLGLLVWGAVLSVAPAENAHSMPQLRPSSSPVGDSSTVATLRARTYFVRGLTEVYLEDYPEAISLFQKALEVSPENPAVLNAVAEAEAHRGDLSSALYYARQARRLGAKAHYHLQYARLLETVGRPEDAIEAYRFLLAEFPSNAEARIALARLQAKQGRPRAAARNYEILVDSSKHVAPEIYREMLDLYRAVGDEAGVEHTLRRLIHLRPDRSQYRRQLGRLYVRQHRYEAALTVYQALREDRPRDPRVLSRLKMLYKETDQPTKAETVGAHVPERASSPDQLVARARSLYDGAHATDTTTTARARALLRDALEQSPKHADALSLLGTIHYEEGRYARAAPILDRALDANPRSVQQWRRVVTAHLRIDSVRRAARLAEEGRLLFPGQAELTRLDGEARLRLGDPAQARDRFRTALSEVDTATVSTSRLSALYVGLGRALTQMGHPARAQRAFETALQRSPNDPRALSHFARTLVHRSADLDRALRLARRAVEAAPRAAHAHATLGWVLHARGDSEAAVQAFETALDHDDVSAWAYERFGDVQRALGNEALARRYWKKALQRSSHPDSLHKKLRSGA